jgi:ZIP family zinc transporter
VYPEAMTSPIALGLLGSLIAGLGTAAGAVPALLTRISDRAQDVMLGFAAGVMLAASFFSLLLPSIDSGVERGATQLQAVGVSGAGLLLGALCLWLVHKITPHEHFVVGREGPDTERLRRIWLFVIAITLHNFPEGLAVGVGFGDGHVGRGAALTLGIGMQNMPEGLAVAVALLRLDYRRSVAFAVAAATGLVEPLGGLVGIAAVSIVGALLPWGLAFAAGAMIFVISHEVIPETHRRGYETLATGGLMVGVATMMIVDAALT